MTKGVNIARPRHDYNVVCSKCNRKYFSSVNIEIYFLVSVHVNYELQFERRESLSQYMYGV